MKIQQSSPNTREYPYLAIWTGGEPLPENEEIDLEKVVIVSMKSERMNEDRKPHIHFLFGSSPSTFTSSEEEYAPLPKGFEIKIVQ